MAQKRGCSNLSWSPFCAQNRRIESNAQPSFIKTAVGDRQNLRYLAVVSRSGSRLGAVAAALIGLTLYLTSRRRTDRGLTVFRIARLNSLRLAPLFSCLANRLQGLSSHLRSCFNYLTARLLARLNCLKYLSKIFAKEKIVDKSCVSGVFTDEIQWWLGESSSCQGEAVIMIEEQVNALREIR